MGPPEPAWDVIWQKPESVRGVNASCFRARTSASRSSILDPRFHDLNFLPQMEEQVPAQVWSRLDRNDRIPPRSRSRLPDYNVDIRFEERLQEVWKKKLYLPRRSRQV